MPQCGWRNPEHAALLTHQPPLSGRDVGDSSLPYWDVQQDTTRGLHAARPRFQAEEFF